MLSRLTRPKLIVAVLVFSALAYAQSTPTRSGVPRQAASKKYEKIAPAVAAPIMHDGWGRAITQPVKGQKPAAARRHDISGTWEPANGPLDGGGFLGAKAMPEDGKLEHQLPFTPLGLETYKGTKPTIGPRMVLPADTNDPVAICDPQGMPR